MEALASVQESTEGIAPAILPRNLLRSVQERRHPGSVIELSDVRREKRRDHTGRIVPKDGPVSVGLAVARQPERTKFIRRNADRGPEPIPVQGT
jgi:hypothetical protein